MTRTKITKALAGIGLMAGGFLFQGNCAGSLARINPCGTLLSTSFCDPLAFERLFGEPFATDNLDIDPTCVVAFACDTTTQN